MTNLAELVAGLDTDKGSRHRAYLPIYENLFKGLWHRPIHLLEVGVADGGSLQLWQIAFPNGRITGVDVRHYPSWVPRGLEVILGDATREETFRGVEGLDIVIDDGSHVLADQLATFRILAPRMVGDWLYVVEDLQEASIKTFQDEGWTVFDLRGVNGIEDDILAVMGGVR